MNGPIVQITNLSKRYQLGTIGYGSLQHDLRSWWAKVNKKDDPNARIGEKSRLDQYGEFWALNNVSFSVTQGDRVGIIGRNGAGKSTLLKLLSRVTSPTTGTIKLRGKVASLLEVGTGFHPELTGRENVFLNGAILGMKRSEISKKFDEIVAFSGVETFIDTPVKRYSSGMYVRLAFSVAAHLDSDILIIDEVLSVGDAEFQKKCIGKMEDVSKGAGRTILFVSHQLNTLKALCNKGVLLASGRVEFDGDIEGATSAYMHRSNGGEENSTTWEPSAGQRFGDVFEPLKVYLEDSRGQVVRDPYSNSETVCVVLEGELLDEHALLNLGFAFYSTSNESEAVFWSCFTDAEPDHWPKLKKGFNRLICRVPPRLLNQGQYRIELLASIHLSRWIIPPLSQGPSITIEVLGGLSDSPYWYEKRPGSVAPLLEWR